MKRFRQILIILGLLALSMFAFGQQMEPDSSWFKQVFPPEIVLAEEETVVKADTVKLTFTTDPIPITIECEPLEKNEVLQKVIEMETVQIESFDENLKSLNQTIENYPNTVIETKKELLLNEGIDLRDTGRTINIIKIVTCISVMMFLIVFGLVLEFSDKSYWNSKTRRNAAYYFIIGLIILGVTLPTVSLGINAPDLPLIKLLQATLLNF